MSIAKGHYMLFKYPAAMALGDNAGFAITMASARQYCEMRFWYMRDSDSIGQLNIKMRQTIGEEFAMLKTISSVSKMWTREQVTIPARLTAIQVRCSATRRLGLVLSAE